MRRHPKGKKQKRVDFSGSARELKRVKMEEEQDGQRLCAKRLEDLVLVCRRNGSMLEAKEGKNEPGGESRGAVLETGDRSLGLQWMGTVSCSWRGCQAGPSAAAITSTALLRTRLAGYGAA